MADAMHLDGGKPAARMGATEILPPGSSVFDESISHVDQKYRGTNNDIHDMSVLGKKQVLKVGFIRTCPLKR